mmetsp:Transcript_36502/g.103097  ORF Transcript_36502/g.103097 Transcript_36502/m.103097 type:complete len:290 (-) Transcript_36502:1379-2248(-)
MAAAMTELWEQVDTAVSTAVFETVEAAGIPLRQWKISPITADLPFVASPTPLMLWIAFYLIVVLGGLIFIKPSDEAKKKEPLLLRIFVQCHNVFLIGLSSYMFGGAIYQAWKNGYNFWGNGYKETETEMGLVMYIFYMSKWYEFFDTFIMLMKGNLKQVSLLHVYHHVSISFIWWIICYAAPGGDAYYSCFLNSLVHIVMYTYYLLAALVGKDPKVRRKYLWWGQYLTMFQMGQFVSMMLQGAYIWMYSPYPKELATLLFFYMHTLLALFAHFFFQKYMSSPQPKKKTT